MNRKAFSLVELLVSLAILALLIAVLIPGLGTAQATARRVRCATQLRELGQALHLYAFDYQGRALPLAYTRGPADDPPVYWWGTNDADGVDHTRGLLWPYLRTELRERSLYECPDQPWGTYLPQGAARQVTSTYGYNGYYLCPPHTPGWNVPGWAYIGDRPWQSVDTLTRPQELFAFADAAIDLGGSQPANNALLDPPFLHLRGTWMKNTAPTTSFRHRGRANAAHADGHVAPHPPGPGLLTAAEFQIGSAGLHNDPHYVPDWRDW